MIGVIAIAGSPNTGKSTLFNRLIASRKALVADYAGVTRDRLYGVCDILGEQYLLIDTGGFSDSSNEFGEQINKQIDLALAEADIILLVVDSSRLPATQDLDLRDIVRKKNKPYLVALNKSDKKNEHSEFYRYYQNFIAISAEHARGIQTLKTQIVRLNDEKRNSQPTPELPQENADAVKLTVLGRPNVGKSTLINRIIGKQRLMTMDIPGTTRDVIDIPFTHGAKQCILFDTPGIRRRSRAHHFLEKFSVLKSLKAARLSDVVIFLFDSTLVEQDLRLIAMIKDIAPSVVFAANKADLLQADTKKSILKEIDRREHIFSGARPLHISALRGNGIKKLLDIAIDTHERACSQWSTSLLNNILQKSLRIEQPALRGKYRPRLKFIHQRKSNPPQFVIHGNQTAKIASNYQRFLYRRYRDALRLHGVFFTIIFRDSDNPYKPPARNSGQ